jgi:hypothetical protein
MSNVKERAMIYATSGDIVSLGVVQNSVQWILRIMREVPAYKLSYLCSQYWH